MPKRTKKTLPLCDQHLFVLKPKSSSCRFSQPVIVSFCDPSHPSHKNKNKKCRNCEALDCPIFQKDKNFATPTFILCSEKQYYDQRGIKMRQEHEKKMVEYSDQKDSLNIPKPRTRNNYCSVCRQVYEDYLEHIDSDKHKKKIKSSLFNQYILDVAQKFNPMSKHSLNYSYATLSTGDEDDVELIQNRPMKKVKTDYEGNERNYYGQELTNKPQTAQIAPPPHLNLSNSAYFPAINQPINYFNPPLNPYTFPPAQNLSFNCNINMFFNPFYTHNPYGMINPWMDCFGMNPVNQMPHFGSGHFDKIDQGYFSHEGIQQKIQHPLYGLYQPQEKNQLTNRQQEIIVIDDDDEQKIEKHHGSV